jgi:hypothetical protein
MRSPICPSVCVSPLITFYPIGRVSWNSVGRSCHWRRSRRLTFNPVPSTIPKWRTFKLLRWMQNLHQSTWDHEILYTDTHSKDEKLLIRPFLSKTKKYEYGGRLNVRIHSLFCGDNSWTVALRQMNWSWTYLQVLFESLFCLTQFLNMAMVRNFEVMLW